MIHGEANISIMPLANQSVLNVTDGERDAYLAHLQAQTTRTMIPAMIFLITLATIGLVGNVLVLGVYWKKFSRTSTRVFIMSIAGFDLISNVIVIPGEVYDMFHYWDFTQAHFCGFRMFFGAFTTISAALILLGVAVVRFRKVCRPFGWQVTTKQSRIICVSIALVSVVFAVPNGIVNGKQTKPTPRPDIVGHECTTDDKFVDTIFPLINTGIFLLLFISSFIPLVILYSMIGVQAWRHSKVYGVPTSPTGHAQKSLGSTTAESKSSDSGVVTKSTNDSSASAQGQIRMNDLGGASMNASFSDDINVCEACPDSDHDEAEDKFDTIDLDDVETPFDNEYLRKHSSNVDTTGHESHVQDPKTLEGLSESRVIGSGTHVSDNLQECIPDHGETSKNSKDNQGIDGVHSPDPKIGCNLAIDNTKIKRLSKSERPSEEHTAEAANVESSLIRRIQSRISAVHRSIRSKSTVAPSGGKKSQKRKGIGRTTTMLLAITVIYITSLLPHLGCMFYKFTSPESYAAMTVEKLMVYNVFLRFYFLNSAANPVIYSLCDINFRKHCWAILSGCGKN